VAASPVVAVKHLAMVHSSEAVANSPTLKRAAAAFFDELKRAGFVDGKNLVVEPYPAEGRPDRFAALTREVVDTRPDAIYALTSLLGLAFKSATTTIPIVALTSDPV
jgi:putative tryptophan/tyrosine transport system substrate-binding protein